MARVLWRAPRFNWALNAPGNEMARVLWRAPRFNWALNAPENEAVQVRLAIAIGCCPDATG
jgi:hypothetical protein